MLVVDKRKSRLHPPLISPRFPGIPKPSLNPSNLPPPNQINKFYSSLMFLTCSAKVEMYNPSFSLTVFRPFLFWNVGVGLCPQISFSFYEFSEFYNPGISVNPCYLLGWMLLYIFFPLVPAFTKKCFRIWNSLLRTLSEILLSSVNSCSLTIITN